MEVTIADFGTGNLHSLSKALILLGADVKVAENIDAWLESEILMIPGDGAFGSMMVPIAGFENALRERILSMPTLGICVGMQILARCSEEGGDIKGLGLIDERIERLQAARLPHMGWNQLSHNENALFEGIEPNAYFYFVHSYGLLNCANAIATSHYGSEFVAAHQLAPSSYAVQFHPEKSSSCGIQLLGNFLNLAKERL